ncbi:MAG TPA: cytochrome C [Lysobacter sp.]
MKTTTRATLAIAVLLPLAACQKTAVTSHAGNGNTAPAQTDLLARGEYLTRTTGCNDCHTPGYAESQGKVDKAMWLVGSPVGFRGPWGTTYPTNLRLKLATMTETQWLDYSATLRTRPLMPDFAIRDMTLEDRRAIYQFVRSLGPGGQPAPAFVPPGQNPAPPYFDLVLPAAPPVAAAGGT